ncbi:MAG: translocation/assembly module TamB domain-containing protein [Bacteroidales bacterium]
MKIIVKIGQLCLYVVASCIVLIMFVYFLLHVPYVQNHLAQYVAYKVSGSINGEVSLSRIEFDLWKTVVLKDVKLIDSHNKQILNGGEVGCTLESVDLHNKQIVIQSVDIVNTSIALVKDSTGILNIQNIFSLDTTQSFEYDIVVNSCTVQKSDFSFFNNQLYESQEFGVNFSDLQISDLQIAVSNINFSGDSLSALIQGASGTEKSGFVLHSLSTNFEMNSQKISCSDVHVFTPESHIHMDTLRFQYDDIADFSEFITNVHVYADFNQSLIQFSDISYFAPSLYLSPYSFLMSGSVSGTVSNFKGKNMHIQYGKNTEFRGNIEMMGLPDISNTFVHLKTDDFITNVYDLEHFRIPPFSRPTYIELPDILRDIVSFSYSGSITGFFTDLVAYGTISTPAGVLESDVSIKQSQNHDNELVLSGYVSTQNFNVSKLGDDFSDVGKTNLNVRIKAYFTDKGFDRAFVKGTVLDVVFQKYTYTDIVIDGLVSEKRFDGYLEINDAHMKAVFYGLFDYSLDVPEFNFTADVPYVNLNKLGFSDDSLARFSIQTEVDFIGMSIDNLKGTINISEAEFTNSLGSYSSDYFTIDVDNIDDARNVSLNSDLIDVSLNGSGLYAELPLYMYQFMRTHIPALPKKKMKKRHDDAVLNFNMSLQVKSLDSLLSLFYPDIQIAQQTHINSVYSQKDSLFVLEASVPHFNIGEFSLQHVSLSSYGNRDSLSMNVLYTLPWKQTSITDISTHFSVFDNQFSHRTSWMFEDSLLYKGDLQHNGTFKESDHATLPQICFSVPHQSVVVADSVWTLELDSVIVDSSSVFVKRASADKNNEQIRLSGTVSDNPNDSLVVSFSDFNVDNLNNLIPADNINIRGIVNGEAVLQNLYESPLFFADINSPDFYFNDNRQGEMHLYSNWNSVQKAVDLEVSFTKGRTDIFSLQGAYVPENQKIDFDLTFEKYFLSDFQELAASIVEGLSGTLDADLSVVGTLQKPVFTGEMQIKRGLFTVVATQSEYNLKGVFRADGSKLVFSDVNLSDIHGNTATTTGFIDLQSLQNPSYRITIETSKLQALKTTEYDNEFVYGSAFFDGFADISGDLQNTRIQVVGKTLENTQINIPLSYSELSDEHDFLYFKNNDTLENTAPEDIQSELSGVELDFNIEVTPDAQCQIIFDKKVGDIIKVRGNSNLRVVLNRSGDLSLFGNYIIEEGDYLFTLKSLINKKFIIQQGGSIRWTGDPLHAQIDVEADYKLKTSPTPLMVNVVDSTTLRSYKSRIPVVCRIYLKNDLMNPDINYTILTPDADVRVQGVVDNLPQEQKNLQFISLLLANNFVNTGSQNMASGPTVDASSSFEAITSQMNYYLSQINDDVDIGLNYRPNNNFSTNEFELALSTQMLNDRVLINLNGYTEFGQNSQTVTSDNEGDFSGDFSVEIKLNEQGNIRLKVFSRSNTNTPIDEKQGNENGVGLFYSKEFNSFRDLFTRKNKKPTQTESK